MRLEGRFTARDYVQVLQDILLPSVRAMAIPDSDRVIFVQDRSPKHTAQLVTQWFEEQPEFVVLDWPSEGCDLNPIKNLWAIMCNDWNVGDERSCDTIERTARDVWESV